MSKTAIGLLFFAIAGALQAAVKLPSLISDHMVLRQGVPVRIWGTADAGEAVRIEFQGQKVAAVAALNGKWTAWLKTAGGGWPAGDDHCGLGRGRHRLKYSGPLYRQVTSEGSQLRVWFNHAESLQAKGGGGLTGFTVAGADGNFVAADARMEGNSVVVWNSQVGSPVAVRYAWADDPVCNLINQAGLPASPFRSDEGSGR